MDTHSIFSTNTFKTTSNNLHTTTTNSQQTQQNPLHKYLRDCIAPISSQQYPHLFKIIALHLLLKDNFIIYTEDRMSIKQVWVEVTNNINNISNSNTNTHINNKAKSSKQPTHHPTIGNIYIIDQHIDISKILTQNKDIYNRLLLYNINKMNINSINYLINYMSSNNNNVSILGVISPKDNVVPHLMDLFVMGFEYKEGNDGGSGITKILDNKIHGNNNDSNNQENSNKSIKQMTTNNKTSYNSHNSSDSKFNRQTFEQQILKPNYETAILQKQQQGFLKSYLQTFQLSLKHYNTQHITQPIQISQWKYKKMFKLLKFLAINKSQDCYKKLGLSQMLFMPELLASSYQQYVGITNIVISSLQKYMPLYGIQKLERAIVGHYWVSQQRKRQILQYTVPDNNNNNINIQNDKYNKDDIKHISFYYPCTKFPQTASICASQNTTVNNNEEQQKQQQQLLIYYRVLIGNQKKLMSDHHYILHQQQYPYNIDATYKNTIIKTNNTYSLQISVCANSQMLVYIGINCYDKNKQPIHPIQACRVQGSEVKIRKIQGEWLYVQDVVKVYNQSMENNSNDNSNDNNNDNNKNNGLKYWPNTNNNNTVYNYQRAIGIYNTNNIAIIPQLSTHILYNKQNPHSTTQSTTYSQIDIQNNCMRVKQQIIQYLSNIQQQQIVLMSHYQGGSFCVAKTINFISNKDTNKIINSNNNINNSKNINDQILPIQKWHNLSLKFSDYKYENTGTNFLPTTKYIRVVIMGHNSKTKQINNRAQLLFKDIRWRINHI